jgi:lipopolysaccharide export system protein LptA
MVRPLARKLAIILSVCTLSVCSLSLVMLTATAQRRSLTLRADMQQANAKTGVITANGNVQLSYPARQIQATANAANYYSRERRIVLSGNVYVLQAGSSLRAETITYLIDEGRFVALPQNQKQVEATILIPEDNEPPIQN